MTDETLEKKIKQMIGILNERQLRQYLGSEAEALGHGGIAAISRISGKARNTIVAGIKDNHSGDDLGKRARRVGGGRKRIRDKNPEVVREIERIVSTDTFGNPEKTLSYTTKSLRKIGEVLQDKGYTVGYDVVGDILKELGYSLQLNQKMLQTGKAHIDRDKQFRYINDKAESFMKQGEPVISVDTKKKELVGNFRNNGRAYSKEKNPTKVLDHDFPLKELGKVAPYGIYDINKNEGFVNLGISSDTAEFAVESIMRWWQTLGKGTYPAATKIYITCDGGGSNGAKARLWKLQLQEFSEITGLEVHVSHFPPGTSKWNKIEHRMFCYISKTWQGIPLISIEAIISLIGSTTTKKGLKITCVRDDGKYETGKKISDEDFAKVLIKPDETCPNWNYHILPQI
jgi:predicted house-cleaning noncanonical NTP pyrophosphatase (MazG superfamily)